MVRAKSPHPGWVGRFLAQGGEFTDTRAHPVAGSAREANQHMMRRIFTELKRRNVFRAGALYTAAAWLLVQVATQVFPFYAVPDWAVRWLIAALAIGFPFWIAFAWYFEFTPQGLKRESEIDPASSIAAHSGRKIDFAIIGVLAIAVVLLLANTFVWHKGAGLHGNTGNMQAPANSIAVLPFTNMSPDKSQGYFSDGIAVDLLNLLTRVPQLQVTARDSSFSFQGKHVPIHEIARKLHVAHILEGSVQKQGKEVRVTAQLIDAATDRQLWSQSYDRKLTDVFAIQDAIAGDVVKHLKIKLLGALPTARKTDPRAYKLFLKARHLGYQLTHPALSKSNSYYLQALKIDPRYLPAWDGLARNAVNEASFGMISPKTGYARARAAERQALSINPNFAPGIAMLGGVNAYYTGNLANQARAYERALALDPSNIHVLNESAIFLSTLGHLHQALKVNEAILRRDPVNPLMLFNQGNYQMGVGKYDAAITSFRMVLALNPGTSGAHASISSVLLDEGNPTAALAEIKREPNEILRKFGLPAVYCALGRKTEADHVLSSLVSKYAKYAAYGIAENYANCGETDQAFAWLDKAAKQHDSGIGGITTDSAFDKIKSDPRWLPYLRMVGFAPSQLAKIKFKVTLPRSSQAPEAGE